MYLDKYNFKNISKLLGQAEDTHLEFKQSQNKASKSLYETYSAFANTKGGYIYLGIEEDKHKASKVVGVNEPTKILKSIVDTLNNKHKVSCNLLESGDIEVIYDHQDSDKKLAVIKIAVREAPYYYKPVYLNDNPNHSYYRNGESDSKCSLVHLNQMNRDKLIYSEHRNDLLLSKYVAPFSNWLHPKDVSSFIRSVYKLKNDDSKFKILDLDEAEAISLMDDINIITLDPDTTNLCLTKAGFLLLGKYNRIINTYQYFNLDYQEKSAEDEVNYRFRLSTELGSENINNILDFYLRVINRFTIVANNKFVLNSRGQRLDNLEFDALREALANSLIHADYNERAKVQIINYKDRIEFINSGSFLPGEDFSFEQNLKPMQRNANLAKLFRKAGFCEETGIGLLTIKKNCELLNYKQPVIEQLFDDFYGVRTKLTIYRIEKEPEENLLEMQNKINTILDSNLEAEIIVSKLSKLINLNDATQDQLLSVMTIKKSNPKLIRELILSLCYKYPFTVNQLASILNRSQKTVEKYLKDLLANKILKKEPMPFNASKNWLLHT
jgi:ATP-dependent DNA helicase RecG